MEITNIRTLIENKLACIDIECDGKCDSTGNALKYNLQGIKQALQVMGFNLDIEINPYYPQDKKPSTYKLTMA